jgi:hypothetical protein
MAEAGEHAGDVEEGIGIVRTQFECSHQIKKCRVGPAPHRLAQGAQAEELVRVDPGKRLPRRRERRLASAALAEGTHEGQRSGERDRARLDAADQAIVCLAERLPLLLDVNRFLFAVLAQHFPGHGRFSGFFLRPQTDRESGKNERTDNQEDGFHRSATMEPRAATDERHSASLPIRAHPNQYYSWIGPASASQRSVRSMRRALRPAGRGVFPILLPAERRQIEEVVRTEQLIESAHER